MALRHGRRVSGRPSRHGLADEGCTRELSATCPRGADDPDRQVTTASAAAWECTAARAASSYLASRITSIWNDVLEIVATDADATFRNLGGSALDAVRIVARIREDLGIRVDPGDVYTNPTLDAFIRHVISRRSEPLTG